MVCLLTAATLTIEAEEIPGANHPYLPGLHPSWHENVSCQGGTWRQSYTYMEDECLEQKINLQTSSLLPRKPPVSLWFWNESHFPG